MSATSKNQFRPNLEAPLVAPMSVGSEQRTTFDQMLDESLDTLFSKRMETAREQADEWLITALDN